MGNILAVVTPGVPILVVLQTYTYAYQSYETWTYTLINLIVNITSLLYKHIPLDITF